MGELALQGGAVKPIGFLPGEVIPSFWGACDFSARANERASRAAVSVPVGVVRSVTEESAPFRSKPWFRLHLLQSVGHLLC